MCVNHAHKQICINISLTMKSLSDLIGLLMLSLKKNKFTSVFDVSSDIYITLHNTLIEYDHQHHIFAIDAFGQSPNFRIDPIFLCQSFAIKCYTFT